MRNGIDILDDGLLSKMDALQTNLTTTLRILLLANNLWPLPRITATIKPQIIIRLCCY